jgi:hypothetical protein
MNRKLRPLAALALVAVLSAGCSDAPSDRGASSTTTGGTKGTTAQDQLVKFAECIRSHGVPHFPDANAKGEFEFGVDVSATVWGKAVDACKDLQPPGIFSTERTPQQQSAGLKFAQCVREHGVTDFPDPVDGEPLINTYKIPSSERKGGMAILNAAIASCRDRLDEAAAGQ